MSEIHPHCPRRPPWSARLSRYPTRSGLRPLLACLWSGRQGPGHSAAAIHAL